MPVKHFLAHADTISNDAVRQDITGNPAGGIETRIHLALSPFVIDLYFSCVIPLAIKLHLHFTASNIKKHTSGFASLTGRDRIR